MLSSNLKALKKDLKIWNKEVFGDLNFHKKELMNELSSLDGLDEGGNLDEEGHEKRLSAPNRGEDDKMVWVDTKDGVFFVKSMYGLLSGGVSLLFPWRSVWRSLSPYRVSFFVWEAAHWEDLNY